MVITAIFMPLVPYWFLKSAANDLHQQAMRDQADLVAHYLVLGENGHLTLDLPPALQDLLFAGLQAIYRAVPSRMKNVEVHIFPDVLHGYMMPGIPKAFDQVTRNFSMGRALAILDGLRGVGAQQSLRQAS